MGKAADKEDDNVQVFCRVRPVAAHVPEDRMCVVPRPGEAAVAMRGRDEQFRFDGVAGPDCAQVRGMPRSDTDPFR